MSRFLLLALLGFSLLITPVTSFAQSDEEEASSYSGLGQGEGGPSVFNQYDKKYKPVQPDKPDDSASIFPNYYYAAYFMRSVDGRPGDMVMRITSPGAITGCVEIKQPTYTINYAGNVMNINMKEAKIGIDKSVRYAHYQCNTKRQMPFIDIPMNRDDLMEKGIQKIVLQTSSIGRFADIKIDVAKEKMDIMTTAPDLRKFGIPFAGQTSGGTFWFYPENTVALYAPGLKIDQRVMDALSNFATSKNMQPLENVLPGYTSKELKERSMYEEELFFVDSRGVLADSLNSETGKKIGTVTIADQYQGAQGPYERQRNVEVYARLPGKYD